MRSHEIDLAATSNAKQLDFFNDDQSKLLHLSGGVGSGKSYMLAMKLIKLSQKNKNIRGGAVMPTYTEYRKDFRPALIEILEDHKIPYRENKSLNTWHFPWSKKEVQVVTAEKRIRGPNWGFAVINELTLMQLVRYQETISRVRIKGAPCPQVASSGTPEGYANDFYEFLIEKPPEGARVINVSTRDNAKNLSSDYIATLEKTFDSMQQAAYIDGEWVNMTTNRFYYKYDPKVHDESSFRFHESDEEDHHLYSQTVHVSMDFNVNPMTCAMWQQKAIVPGTGLRQIGCFDELVMKGDADTNRMCKGLLERGYTPDRVIIYADPAGRARSTKGQPDVKILQSYGFEVKAKLSHPRMRQRMLNANNLFDKQVVVINPTACPGVKKDLLNVSFNQATLEKDKSNLMLTHLSDGMDYMFDILYPFSGNREGISSVKIR